MIGLTADPRVLVQPQVLTYGIAIPGTGHRLCFASDRLPGWRGARELRLPLVGPSVPSRLRRIEVEFAIGDRVEQRSYDPIPDLTAVYLWDGLDADARAAASALVTVRAEWIGAGRWPRPSRSRSREWQGFLGGVVTDDGLATGWRLDVHHALDPVASRSWWGSGGSDRTGAATVTSGLRVVAAGDLTEVHLFDEHGRLVRSLDAVTGLERRRFEYNGAGVVALVEGGATRFERAAGPGTAGVVAAIVAPDGRRTELEQDASGRLVRVVAAGGAGWTMTYGGRGELTSVTTPAGGTYTFAYEDDRLVEWADPSGVRTALVRREVGAGVTISRIGPLQDTETFEDLRWPGGARRRSANCCAGGERIEERAAAGGPVHVVEPDGTVGELTSAPDPIVEGLSRTVREIWRTPSGRTVTVGGGTEVGTGAALGSRRVDRLELPGGPYAATWDPEARVITYRTAEGRESRVELDEAGQAVASVTPSGARRTFESDDQGRLVAVRDGIGERRWAYNRSGVRSTVAGRPAMGVRLDDAGRVESVELPGGAGVRIEWRGDGTPERIVVPSGGEYRLESGALGLVERMVTPAGREYRATFDAARRLTRLVQPSGRTVESTWDGGDRLLSRTFDGGRVEIAYTPAGTLDHAIRTASGGPTQSVRHRWDGPLVLEQAWDGALSATCEYARDERGSLTAIRVSAPGVAGAPLAVEEDRDGWPLRLGPVAFVRAADPRHVAVARVGDAQCSTERDARDRVVRRSLTVAGRVVHELEVEWDATDHVVASRELLDGRQTALRYAYDDVGRLIGVTEADAASAERFRCEYDANGNRTAWSDAGVGRRAQSDVDDRLERLDGEAVLSDADGFLAALPGGGELTYSGRGELLRAAAGGGMVEYDHDPAGRRVARRANGETTGFVYGDPRRPFAVTAILEGGRLHHLFADDAGVVAAGDGADLVLVASDWLGTPRALFDSTGRVLGRISRDVWGVLLEHEPATHPTAAAVMRWVVFAGGLGDPETGLVRFGHRDYVPMLGRWTAPDPLGFGSGDWNLYTYAGNDPVSGRDPGGLHHEPEQDAFYGPHPVRPLPDGFFDPRPTPPVFETGDTRSGRLGNLVDWLNEHRNWNSRYGWGMYPTTGGYNICPGPLNRDGWNQSGVNPGSYRDPGTGHVGPSNPYNNSSAPTTFGVNVVIRTF